MEQKQFNIRKKIAKGEGCITLGPNKPCYKCKGTREYAKQINCRLYLKDVEEENGTNTN